MLHMVCLLMEIYVHKFAVHPSMPLQEQENVFPHVLLGIIQTQKIMETEKEWN